MCILLDCFVERPEASWAAIIVAHNHPSCDTAPSHKDVLVERRLVEAGEMLDIEVLDHLVVGRERYVGLEERGLELD